MRQIPTLESTDATTLREAAKLAATEAGVAATIAIVDLSGALLDLYRCDDAKPHTVELATRKARTAALLGLETQLLEGMAAEGRPFSSEVLAMAGGAPVLLEGRCAGAVGVSGGASEIDHKIAVAAVSALRI